MDKQRSTKHTYKTKHRITGTPLPTHLTNYYENYKLLPLE